MRRRPIALAIGLLLLGASCASERAGVDIRKLSTDIAFGVKLAKQAAPANFGPPAPAPQLDLKDIKPKYLGPPLAAVQTCPPAALEAFPEREASHTIIGRPAVGEYRWKKKGTQTQVSLPIPLPIQGFEKRLVRNYVKTSATDYTYETVQADMSLGSKAIVVTTWQVKTAPFVQDVDAVVTSTRIGEPERGISLKQIDTLDEKGNLVGRFAPTPAVLYFPLAVVPGDSWNTAGVDLGGGQTLQHQAEVLKRERVDACGEVIDGWLVRASQTFTGTTTQTRNYEYIMAPHLGGLMISEKIDATGAAGTLKATFSIGQTKPDPLPKSAS